MQVISFQYDKKDGSAVKRYFVAVKDSNKEYIKGFDLQGGGYKQFLRNKIVPCGEIIYYGQEEDVQLINSKLLSRQQLLDEMGFKDLEIEFINEFNITDDKLQELFTRKTGKKTVCLSDHFLVFDPLEKLIPIKTKYGWLYIKVTSNSVHFLDGSKKDISLDVFIKTIFGL